jgi:hypothetical protein
MSRLMHLPIAFKASLSLFVVSFFSLRRLKRLDVSSSIEIVHVLFDTRGPDGTPYGAIRFCLEATPYAQQKFACVVIIKEGIVHSY